MKKSRNKIIIKSRKGGYTKLYANGKWQKRVYNLDFHADVTPLRNPAIKAVCEFDRHKTDAHGKLVIENDEIVSEHHRIVLR